MARTGRTRVWIPFAVAMTAVLATIGACSRTSSSHPVTAEAATGAAVVATTPAPITPALTAAMDTPPADTPTPGPSDTAAPTTDAPPASPPPAEDVPPGNDPELVRWWPLVKDIPACRTDFHGMNCQVAMAQRNIGPLVEAARTRAPTPTPEPFGTGHPSQIDAVMSENATRIIENAPTR